MPDTGASRKRPIWGRRIPGHLTVPDPSRGPSILGCRMPPKLKFECSAFICICAAPWGAGSTPPAVRTDLLVVVRNAARYEIRAQQMIGQAGSKRRGTGFGSAIR
jgi:hypothetical protein